MRMKTWIFLLATTALTGHAVAQEQPSFDIEDNEDQLEAWGVSGDGSVIVGELGAQAMRMTFGGTPTQIGGQDARAVSGDGSVIVGWEVVDADDFAVRWNGDGTGMQRLSMDFADLSGSVSESWAYGVSQDGSVIVGNAMDITASLDRFAVRWTNGDLSRLTGMPVDTQSVAFGVSGDGSTIVGSYYNAVPENDGTAFTWTETGGLTSLGMLNGGGSAIARAASGDGSVVVGRAADGSYPVVMAVRWVNGGLAESLGDLVSGVGGSEAYDVSDDGSVIVGSAMVFSGGIRQRAFRWESGTMQTVENWLRDAGVSIAEDVTLVAHGTNADGSVIVGKATDDRIFIARGPGSSGDTGGGDTGGGDTGGGDTGGGDTGGGDTGGGDTGGGDTGGGDTGGGETGGGDTGGGDVDPGLIYVEDVVDSLAQAGATGTAVLSGMNVQLNGAGGRPLDRRALSGRPIAWVTGDLGRVREGSEDGTFGVGELGFGHNFDPVQVNASFGVAGQTLETMLGGETRLRMFTGKVEAISRLHTAGDSSIWAVLTGAAIVGHAEIDRNYLANGGATVTSRGSTDLAGAGVRGRLQWENALPYISPFAELAWSRACMDGYTETGGPGPASFDSRCASETQLRYGADVTVPVTRNMRVTGTLQGVHRIGGSTGATTGQLVGLDAFSLPAAHSHDAWLRGGIGCEVDLTENTTFSIMANGTTTGGAGSAWATANLRMHF